MYEIKAVVKFNSWEALVLNKYPQVKYEKHGNYLFGVDEYGIFVDVYGYERPIGRFKAFAGHEFDIPMVDGSVTKASGQWWDIGTSKLEESLGSKVVMATINTRESLARCYVFYGAKADGDEYKKLRDSYEGKVYEYREYENLIKLKQ